MITAWRLVSPRLARNAFDGEGARRFGGRWNSVGTRVVYLSQTVSLSLLETIVHTGTSGFHTTYALFKVQFDENLIERIFPKALSPLWKSFPPHSASQSIGDQWVAEGRSPVLQVPSVIVDRESNFLLNPLHPHFSRIVIGVEERLHIDRRLLREFAEGKRGN